jgi:hypothetical protein
MQHLFSSFLSLLEYVSVSVGHHKVQAVLLKLLHCHPGMSRVNALLFFKYLKLLKFIELLISHAVSACQLWVFCLLRWYVNINSLLRWSVLCAFRLLIVSYSSPTKHDVNIYDCWSICNN